MKAQKTNIINYTNYKMVSKKIICILIAPLSETITITEPVNPSRDIFCMCASMRAHTCLHFLTH